MILRTCVQHSQQETLIDMSSSTSFQADLLGPGLQVCQLLTQVGIGLKRPGQLCILALRHCLCYGRVALKLLLRIHPSQ